MPYTPPTFTTSVGADVLNAAIESGGTGLDFVNGSIGSTELSGLDVTPSMIHPGAVARTGMVGGTGNLDYFSDAWKGLVNGDRASATESNGFKSFLPIPRCAKTFYLPTAFSKLLVMGHVSCANDGVEADGTRTVLRLFYDGDAVAVLRAGVPPSVHTGIRFGSFFQRTWTVFYVIDNPTMGEHSVYVGIAADADQSRLRSRGLAVIGYL